MSDPNSESYLAEPHFSPAEAVQRHKKLGLAAARMALAVIGVATLGGALMAERAGSEAVPHDLRAPVAAVSYYEPQSGIGTESPMPMNNREPQPAAAYVELMQEGHTADNEANTAIEDMRASEMGWRPDDRSTPTPEPLPGSVVYD